MSDEITINAGKDGFYHPENEEQIIQLVKKAYTENLQIRCRGAAHSLAHVIYTDPGKDDSPVPNKVSEQFPPKGPNINIMFDKYNKLTWIDEEQGIVEVEAGIHLGYDPMDPAGRSSLKNSLLYQAFKKGWALNDLGGITHQTVSGFMMTGSAGGTLMYSLEDNLLALRIIDGSGNVQWIEKEKDNDTFNAFALSMGLLGIVSRVKFKLTKNYFIYGQQITTPTDSNDSPIDLFGNGSEGKPSMKEFLMKTPYTRILWWPQKKVERVVIWEAVRGAAIPIFSPMPYREFGDQPFSTQLEQLGGALLFTMLGNNNFFTIWKKLGKDFKQFLKNVKNRWGQKTGKFLSWILSSLTTLLIYIISFIVVLFFSVFKFLLIWLYPAIVSILQPLTKEGKADLFMDYMWRSLPMDNEADDILMGTEFTEIWVPLSKTREAMQLLKKLFDEDGIAASGYYATEMYAGIKSNYWMSPSYKEDTLRIDVFWYINNAGNPAGKDGLFSKFWEILRINNIPFRLHWGKFLPEYNYKEWTEYFRSQFPRWDDFMKLRSECDPKNIFLTSYWRRHLFGEE